MDGIYLIINQLQNLALTIDLMQQHYLPCSVDPHGQQVHLSPLYDILDHAICITNHICSESLSSTNKDI